MLPIGFKTIVTRLDAGSLTALMRALLQAEADRLGLPANAVVVSDALTEGDGGLDARTDDVPADSQTIPPGSTGFQFKAYKAKTIGPKEIEKELAKAGPTRVLKGKGTYVLVWQADLNDQQRTNAEVKLRAEAAKIAADGKIEVWDASAIVSLAERYPAVVAGLELVEFGAVRALPEMEEALRVQERPYEADEARAEAIAHLRARAVVVTTDAIVATVSGLAGTGKTRLVAEALSDEPIRDQVLYADSAQGLHTFIARVVRDERTRGILVVDELDEADRDSIHSRFAATRGRWRLLAIVPQTTRRLRASASRDVVLVPLDQAAMRRLIETTSGLSEVQAARVANAAQGFPELAFRLAEELQLDPDLDLVRLAHLDRPHDVLNRALPEQALRDALKPLALFAGLGVDGDLAYQLDEVAAAFGRDPTALRQIMDLELSRHRFVSAAGRYRMVSPTLMAIWLAVELIDETPELDRIIAGLSDPVQGAFFRQLELLGPDSGQLAPAIERLLEAQRFRSPGLFDEAAGRFLRAAAAVVPAQVASAIDRLLSESTEARIRQLPRRDLVWALEILLWWPETWETAITNLYRLALFETETWANNATGSFRDAFSVYLSGSTVAFDRRIAWLERTIDKARPSELPLLGRAAAKGLDRDNYRAVVGFRGGGEPNDWQPKTVGEQRAARSAAWRQLLAILDRVEQPERAPLVKMLGRGTTTMVLDGLLDVVDADLRSRRWSSAERSELLNNVQRQIRVDKFPEESRSALLGLRDWLEGASTEQRLRTVLATPVWSLQENAESALEDPSVLVELAGLIAESENAAEAAVRIAREDSDPDTRFRFLMLVGKRIGAEALGDARNAWEPGIDTVALAAALSVADETGDSRWADDVLERLAIQAPAELPLLTTYTRVTPARITRALDIIDAGRASAGPLANLRGGGRFLTLDPTLIRRVLYALAAEGQHESAMGMLLQVLESVGTSTPWVQEAATELTAGAVSAGTDDTMIEYYAGKFVERELFDSQTLANLWESRMRNRAGLVDELDEVLTERTITDAPRELLERVLDLIRDEASGAAEFSFFTSRDLALLSRLAAVLGVSNVWSRLGSLNAHEFRIAVHHMRWSGDEPDPLVEHFLGSSRLEGYESEAFSSFFNTLGVVSGDYWRALARELDRARSWRSALVHESARTWADQLVSRYEHDVEWQRRREEEEDFRLGG